MAGSKSGQAGPARTESGLPVLVRTAPVDRQVWLRHSVLHSSGYDGCVVVDAAVTARSARPGSDAARQDAAADGSGEADDLRVRLRSAAHEIRTPLTGAVAVADILAASDLPATTLAYVDLLRQAVHQVVAVANDILDVGRIEAEYDLGTREVMAPGRLLGAITGLAAPRAEAKGLALVLDAPDLPPFLRGHPVMLRRAVENLVDNALKHTVRGSVVVAARWTGALLAVEVSDTGDGIADADLPRLFQPYAQLASGQRAGGTGLGLALVKGAVERMGGAISVTRTAEGGARFAITVPLELAEEPPARRAMPEIGRAHV